MQKNGRKRENENNIIYHSVELLDLLGLVTMLNSRLLVTSDNIDLVGARLTKRVF